MIGCLIETKNPRRGGGGLQDGRGRGAGRSAANLGVFFFFGGGGGGLNIFPRGRNVHQDE